MNNKLILALVAVALVIYFTKKKTPTAADFAPGGSEFVGPY